LQTRGVDIYGIDIEPTLVETAKNKGVPGEVADGNKPLPFQDGEFNAVIFSESTEHLDISKAFAEASRVLKPDGKIYIVSNINGGNEKLVKTQQNKKQFRKTLEKNGFLYVSTKSLKDYNEKIGKIELTFIQAQKASSSPVLTTSSPVQQPEILAGKNQAFSSPVKNIKDKELGVRGEIRKWAPIENAKIGFTLDADVKIKDVLINGSIVPLSEAIEAALQSIAGDIQVSPAGNIELGKSVKLNNRTVYLPYVIEKVQDNTYKLEGNIYAQGANNSKPIWISD
jgi:hypothetical protein